MRSNSEMVDYLSKGGWIKSPAVKNAFLSVDRALFVSSKAGDSAYFDSPLPTMDGQTISAPSVVAIMLEKLNVKKGNKVLEVGTGSGYNTALLSRLAGKSGRVISIELYEGLYKTAKKNLDNLGGCGNVELIRSDGSCGYDEHAPYDRIVVTAGMPYIENHPMAKQLKPDGIMVAPAGEKFYQDLVIYSKGKYEKFLPVMFVPLTGKCGFKKD